jgi:hypothetical protein
MPIRQLIGGASDIHELQYLISKGKRDQQVKFDPSILPPRGVLKVLDQGDRGEVLRGYLPPLPFLGLVG